MKAMLVAVGVLTAPRGAAWLVTGTSGPQRSEVGVVQPATAVAPPLERGRSLEQPARLPLDSLPS